MKATTLSPTLGETCQLVEALLLGQPMASLWNVHDAGMPVFVHTVDVALLAIERFPEWQSLYGSLDLGAVVLGSLLHDLSKATCRSHRQFTHSWVMINQPELAAAEAMDALDQAQLATGIAIDYLLAEGVSHIVVSHHGPWGKIQPATPEADLVYGCDLYSAQHHRISPTDANDILPLLTEGMTRAKAARYLGVSASVVRSRLLEACAAERVSDNDELLEIWQSRGRVRVGSPEKAAQLERARWLMMEARRGPECIVGALMGLQGVLK